MAFRAGVVRFHVDDPLGISYILEDKGGSDTLKTFKREVKQAVQKFIDWVKIASVQLSYPKVSLVPVYLPSLYRYPRREGRTNQLRKSLTAAFEKGLNPRIEWNAPYASFVHEKSRVRTPGTSPDWHEKLRYQFSMKLRQFLRDLLGNIASSIKITSRPDP